MVKICIKITQIKVKGMYGRNNIKFTKFSVPDAHFDIKWPFSNVRDQIFFWISKLLVYDRKILPNSDSNKGNLIIWSNIKLI